MGTALRVLTIVAAIVLLALIFTPTLHARPQSSAADVTLLNRERAAAGCRRYTYFAGGRLLHHCCRR